MQNINSQPLVSVVIATYNMGQYISQSIDSILQQTWSNLEVIVVDDGSTDNTPAVMEQYANNHKVRYIKNENQGQPKAKNCGIKATQGEYIAFCDADDFWETNKLELQMPLFANPKVGVVYSEVSFIDENNKRFEKAEHEVRHSGKITNQMLIENFVPFGTSVIRRACIEQDGIFDESFRMGIDWDLWLRYSINWEFCYCPEKTYVYRVWSGQMSNNYKGRYDHAFRILKKFEDNYYANIDKKFLRLAWSDMFIRRGLVYARNEKTKINPSKDILQGISLNPLDIAGWKALLKVVIGWHK